MDGVVRTGLWLSPPEGKDNTFAKLRTRLMQCILDRHLHISLLKHSASPTKECPWDTNLTDKAIHLIQEELGLTYQEMDVAPGQPFRLGLLRTNGSRHTGH